MGLKRVGLWPNLSKRDALHFITKTVHWLEGHQVEVYLPLEMTSQLHGFQDLMLPLKELQERIDLAIIFGGDGTFLNAAAHFAPFSIPLLGVNLGQLGFLTEVDKVHLYEALSKLITGDYLIEERIMLGARYYRHEEVYQEALALNEVVISKGSFTRIIYIRIMINNEELFSYPADGVIIATPTGSTAYSLSAGGPIISPALRSLVITPICPHSLHSRSVVVDSKEQIRVSFGTEHGEIFTAIDGQRFFHLQPEDVVEVSTAKQRVLFVRLPEYTFYQILKSRMK